MRQKQHEKKEH